LANDIENDDDDDILGMEYAANDKWDESNEP
jgi:hypothetical protein